MRHWCTALTYTSRLFLTHLLLRRGFLATSLPLQDLAAPLGFNISLYTDQVPRPRYLAISKTSRPPISLTYISTNGSQVYALIDRQGTGAPEVVPILDALTQPNGVAWLNGTLYVAQPNAILQYTGADDAVLAGKALGSPGIVLAPIASLDGSPKILKIGPDRKLYYSVGPSCDQSGTCRCGDAVASAPQVHYCSIARVSLDGAGATSRITGVRDVGGLAFDPSSQEPVVAFTSQHPVPAKGPSASDDLLYYQDADDAVDLGAPLCQWHGRGSPIVRSIGPGNATADATNAVMPQLITSSGASGAKQASCSGESPPPAQALGPRVAAMGLSFYPGAQPGYNSTAPFPRKYVNSTAFIAEHGSPSSPAKPGFRVAAVTLTSNGTEANATAHINFISGWLSGGIPWGRPVDTAPLLDGSLLVSDDLAGAVYRVTYDPQALGGLP
ncbi:hypothetical protein CVIRNUC_010430 [Coccomyxa viridis]|uniref:Uncharacterized protein n=1 Tax=Coccomyxa viridis TaxID=1274662 RepID=A0AAV1IIR4_9CHLO|nr:hypothetical protein CVIRNUC_010430 [Coccomyxa viridis]